jgi:glycosyltransferase involved in cell wall biosynthesis
LDPSHQGIVSDVNKLSIITITFNNFQELKTTLNSTIGIQNIESVVINGGICQETKDFLNAHPEYNSVSESDEGISDAFNKGIKLSTGDAIAFLNSGDKLIDISYYDFANEYFLKHPDIDYIYADIIFNHNEHGELLVKPHPNDRAKTPFPHPSLIVRKSVFLKIGGFDKNLKVAMDFDFMCKMIKGNYKGYYYTKAPVVWMDGNGASSSDGQKGINERLLVLNRYNLLDFNSKIYLNTLTFKIKARKLFESFHLLNSYDHFKKIFFKPKSE